MIFTSNLSWGNQVDYIVIKAGKRVDILAQFMYRLDRNSLEMVYKSFIRPTLEYGDIIMSNMADEHTQLIEHVNKTAVCIISGAIRGTTSNVLFEEVSRVSNIADEHTQLIEHVNKRAAWIISGAIRGTTSNVLFEEVYWVLFEIRMLSIKLYSIPPPS